MKRLDCNSRIRAGAREFDVVIEKKVQVAEASEVRKALPVLQPVRGLWGGIRGKHRPWHRSNQ